MTYKTTSDYSYRDACRELKGINGKRYRKFSLLFPFTVYLAVMISFILSLVITSLITGNRESLHMIILPLALLPPFVIFELLLTLFSPRRNVLLNEEGIHFAARKSCGIKWAVAHTKWEDITAISLERRGGRNHVAFALEIATKEAYWEPDYDQEIEAPNFKLIHDIKKSHPEIPVTAADRNWLVLFFAAIGVIGGIAAGSIIK